MKIGKVKDGRYRFGPLMIMTKPMHWFAPEYQHVWVLVVDDNDYSKVIGKHHEHSWGGLVLSYRTKIKPGEDLGPCRSALKKF